MRCGSEYRDVQMRTSSTSQPPKLTPRTEWHVGHRRTEHGHRSHDAPFCEPYGKPGLMGLSPKTHCDNSPTARRVNEATRPNIVCGSLVVVGGQDGEEKGKGDGGGFINGGAVVSALKWGTSPSAEQGRPRWLPQSSEKTCLPPARPSTWNIPHL